MVEAAPVKPVETEKSKEAEGSRIRSTIVFPYNDIDDAQNLAEVLHGRGGSGDTASLAMWMGHDSVGSGAFRTKLYASRDFGIVNLNDDRVELADLGHRMVDPKTRDKARAEAFRNIPLFDQVFEKFKGRLLPPDVGLERVMLELGVAPKQCKKARQVMARAAEQAGYFSEGKDRLVTPAALFSGVPTAVADKSVEKESSGNGDGGNGPGPAMEKSITLDSGGTVSMSVTVDLFTLSEPDRKFVLDLVDKLKAYEERKMLPPGSTNGPDSAKTAGSGLAGANGQ
ncbi:MAG: hypothetical protein OXG19_09635 [Chloroflexi bacterium]|nr:hypothetical protein [Chloroflexota bacterium]